MKVISKDTHSMNGMYPKNNKHLGLMNGDEEKSKIEGDKKHVEEAKRLCDSYSNDMERVNIRNCYDVRISMTI